MFKKIELWVVFLILLAFLVGTIFFGALIRHEYQGGKKYPELRKIAVFVASIPSNIRNTRIRIKDKGIVIENLIDKPPIENKNLSKPKLKFFKKIKRDALFVLPRYDAEQSRSIVEIIDLNNFETIHTYKHDITAMNNKIDIKDKQFEAIRNDTSEIRFKYVHPLIFEDGSLVSEGDYGPLFKIDVCSNLEWINQEHVFHHSKMLDAKGDIWVGAHLYPYSELIQDHYPRFGFLDDAIVKIDKNGKILLSKSIAEILYENKILNIYELFQDGLKDHRYNDIDPLHLNDIEPALKDTMYWKKDDLFISIRNKSAIIHYRPSTNKVINYIKGPFAYQHDVDIISDNEISIYNNNNYAKLDSSFSQIVIYNFENNQFSRKGYGVLRSNNFKSETGGLSHILKDGSMLVEETDYGRILFIDKKSEELEWEYVNKDRNDKGEFEVYGLQWSRVIEDIDKVKKIKESIKKKKC